VEKDGSLTPVLQEKEAIFCNTTDTSGSDSTVIISGNEHGQMSCHSYENFCIKTEMPDFNLTELLELAPMGKAIISFYNDNNCLNDSLRNKLVDIIMRHLFSFHCKQ
jgi:hypothetical protein